MDLEEARAELERLDKWSTALLIAGAGMSVVGAIVSVLRIYKEKKETELEMKLKYDL